MGKHAVLSPSSAHRWLACPGSIEAQRGLRSESSVFAAEGTAAHALAATCLQQALNPARFTGLWVTTTGALSAQRPTNVPLMTAFQVTSAMTQGVAEYLDAVADWTARLTTADGRAPDVYIEQPVILTADCWGTADCLIHQPGEHMALIDFKFGAGYVEEKENAQLLTYALAAMQTHCPPLPARITLGIVQPRSDRPTTRHVTYTLAEVQDMTAHWETGIAAALQADAPRIAGPHCKYCKAEAFCEARTTEGRR